MRSCSCGRHRIRMSGRTGFWSCLCKIPPTIPRQIAQEQRRAAGAVEGRLDRPVPAQTVEVLSSSRFVRLDQVADFGLMELGIRPGVDQVFGAPGSNDRQAC